MSGELTIEGVVYISSKRASEITGYSQDYVGQLARAGKILGKRVGGLWYIVADSLSGYKDVAETYTPSPPTEVPKSSEDSSIVTLEGKTYVSAARAAKQTSYHQDYIGQLARSGKILSKQIGKRWYVDVEALKSHKKEKDALLGAVQVTAVGLDKSAQQAAKDTKDVNPADPYDVGLHYTYKAEASPLIPAIEVKRTSEPSSAAFASSDLEHQIPIRVVRTSINSTRTYQQEENVDKKTSRISVLSIFLKTFPVLMILGLSVIVYNFSPAGIPVAAVKLPVFERIINLRLPDIGLKGAAMRLFSKELHYSRE